MTKKYDALIIGAGIIGASIAFELAKKGYKTLNVDKLSAAGAGSTINSCAIIRTHYSTLEGTAMAYESYLHWKNWAEYLGVEDERGYATVHQTDVPADQEDSVRKAADNCPELAVRIAP